MEFVEKWMLTCLAPGDETDTLSQEVLFSSFSDWAQRSDISLELRHFIRFLLECSKKHNLPYAKKKKHRQSVKMYKNIKFKGTKQSVDSSPTLVKVSVIQQNYALSHALTESVSTVETSAADKSVNIEEIKVSNDLDELVSLQILNDNTSLSPNQTFIEPMKESPKFENIDNLVVSENLESSLTLDSSENQTQMSDNYDMNLENVEDLSCVNLDPNQTNDCCESTTIDNENFTSENVSCEPKFHSFFGKVKLKTKSNSEEMKTEKPLSFHFKVADKENEYFDNQVFAKHYQNVRAITPKNLPCDHEDFEKFLTSKFPNNDAKIWARCKNAQTNHERRIKVFLAAAFLPIEIGSKSASFLSFPHKVKFPQFTLCDPKNIVAQCEVCLYYSDFLCSNGLGRLSSKYNCLQGFRQIYEHYISKNHSSSIRWLKENKSEVSPNMSSTRHQATITEFVPMENKSFTHCCYVWENEIVQCFRNDAGIRRKQPKTLFSERRLSSKCSKLDGHQNCFRYKEWKKKHKAEYHELCTISNNSSRSVYVNGKNTIFLNGRSFVVEGGIKSLEPPCLGTASTKGDHPYTCKNCQTQVPVLLNNMKKKEANKLSKENNRIGTRGFRSSYASNAEKIDYFDVSAAETKELKQAIVRYRRQISKSKTWEDKLSESCENENDKKLVIDLLMLLQKDNESIQMTVLRNLVGKLKSGRNHHYTEIIKDIGELHRNRLGPSNYSLLKSLVGLPSKTTCNDHHKDEKFDLGFDVKKIDTAIKIYSNYPVVDCTDEARILRFISPIKNTECQDIELIGECWDPNIDKWKHCLKFVPSATDDSDQYTLLKSYIDNVIESGNIAKDVAIHNFASLAGPIRSPHVYMAWPSPNKGYTAAHLLKIWDHVRRACFLEADNTFRINPLMLLGHSSDSAGFQLAAAKALVSPNQALLSSGIKYLSLGIGESAYAAPYLGPLPAIAYLDYDHEQRLFLKCLKYETLDLTFWPGSCIATIIHLKELQKILLDKHLEIPFLESDLLLARYMDQNCDAAIRIFKEEVADLLETHVEGSEGTVLYIRAVALLMFAFRNHSCDPSEIQANISAGITIFRLWEKLVRHKSLRLNAGPGASTNPNRKGNFITSGCYKTAEILFAAATNHMLAMFAHFKHLGPESISPSAAGTKTTERIICELQGKTNQLQSLDAQPTLQDILHRIKKVSFNQQTEEKLVLLGASKDVSTSRKKLAHKITMSAIESNYVYPDSYEEFKNKQIESYKNGCVMGQKIFSKYCANAETYLRQKGLWETSTGKPIIPKGNLFQGYLSPDYGVWALTTINSADYLSPSNNYKDDSDVTSDSDYSEDKQDDLKQIEEVSLCEVNDKICEEIEKAEENLNDLREAKPNMESVQKIENAKWYITRKNGNEKTNMHIKTALKFLLPREYVSRERRHRHIASNFLPGLEPIDKNHDIALFDYATLHLSTGVELCKIIYIAKNGKSLVSENSSASDCLFRAMLLEKVCSYGFKPYRPVRVTKQMSFNHLICKFNLQQKDGLFFIIEDEKQHYDNVLKNFSTMKDFKIAKGLQASSIPLEYQEVEEILNRKIDQKTHGYIYEVKFNGSVETMWVSAADFLEDVIYQGKRAKKTENSTKVVVKKQFAIPSNPKKTSRKRGFQQKNKIAFNPENSDPKRGKMKKGEENCLLKRTHIQNETLECLSGFVHKKQRHSKWVDDETIYEVSTLLKKHYPDTGGLLDTLFSCNYYSVGIGGMQIHHDGRNHWLFSIDHDAKVQVFDSLFAQPNSNVCQQLLQCYSHRVINNKLEIEYPRRQQQAASDDCGLFAVAYATEAATALQSFSDTIFFDQSQMRNHLAECLSNQFMTAFPKQTGEGRTIEKNSIVINAITGEYVRM